MLTVKDFKGRLYRVLEIGRVYTILECLKTHDRIQIRSANWYDVGFIPAGN